MSAERLDLQQHRPHPARVYDYLLGGKDNYRVDREAADRIRAVYPQAATAARANREFMHRATRYLAGRGLRQWLDIGTGIPTSPNLHEVAQSVAPDARVVYADNDPIVLAHARALMDSNPEGRTTYVAGDLREPDGIMREAREVLDFEQPVVLSIIAVLHFLPDDHRPYALVAGLVDRLAPGSVLVLSHPTADVTPDGELTEAAKRYTSSGVPTRMRTRGEIARFFDGLDLLDPGLVPTHRWRPDEALPGAVALGGSLTDAEVAVLAGVAAKR